jgi:hypothetical protein
MLTVKSRHTRSVSMILHFEILHAFVPLHDAVRINLIRFVLFGLFTAWEGAACQEDPKRQVTTSTQLYGLLKP